MTSKCNILSDRAKSATSSVSLASLPDHIMSKNCMPSLLLGPLFRVKLAKSFNFEGNVFTSYFQNKCQ